MKALIITLTLLSSFYSWSQNAPITVGQENFENWTANSAGELPKYWDGFNRIIEYNGMKVGSVTCISKDSTNPKEGKYAVQLRNESVMGTSTVPGLLTTGNLKVDFNNQTGDITGGEAISKMPLKLGGWFKYSPGIDDTAFVSVVFVKNGQQVGKGRLEISDSVKVWKQFTVDIDFPNGETPDSMNILFSSSTKKVNAPVGSVMHIDAIGFEYGNVGLVEKQNEQVEVYPNPTSSVLNVKGLSLIDSDIKVLNSCGRVLEEYKPFSSEVVLDFSHYTSGYYFLEISTGGNTSFHKVQVK